MTQDAEQPMRSPNSGESLYILTKALPIPLFIMGAISAVNDWHSTAQVLIGAAIAIWLIRVFLIGPIMKLAVGKRRLKSAWNDARDRA